MFRLDPGPDTPLTEEDVSAIEFTPRHGGVYDVALFVRPDVACTLPATSRDDTLVIAPNTVCTTPSDAGAMTFTVESGRATEANGGVLVTIAGHFTIRPSSGPARSGRLQYEFIGYAPFENEAHTFSVGLPGFTYPRTEPNTGGNGREVTVYATGIQSPEEHFIVVEATIPSDAPRLSPDEIRARMRDDLLARESDLEVVSESAMSVAGFGGGEVLVRGRTDDVEIWMRFALTPHRLLQASVVGSRGRVRSSGGVALFFDSIRLLQE